ncbi:MAG: TlpA family protein disulfide reductase [Gemmatimonadaceae bacterium]|nr:TlpA family protein disulfide reductase [Gemmatimonadaceae bacterium]
MTARKQWTIVGVVVVAIGVALYAATRTFGSDLFPVAPGSKAPEFQAATMVSGGPATKNITDYRGHVVLLNLWATWCGPCKQEMPGIQALHDSLGPQGLKVVAVSVDDPGFEKAIKDFVAEHKLTFEVLHEGSGKIERDYQTSGIPETFVIGKDGVIRKRVIGAAAWNSASNMALMRGLLAEDAP